MSAGDDKVTATGTASGDHSSQTFAQFGLDADDAFFGRYARALLECESLAALRATSSPQHISARPLSPNRHPRSPFRVAIARNAATGADTDGAARQIGPAAFEVDSPMPDQNSFTHDTAPESGPWFVRSAFPDRASVGASSSTSCDLGDDILQSAIRVSVPTKTLTRNAWLDSWFVTVLLWVLPAATVVLYCHASLPSPFVPGAQSNVVFVFAFVACALLAIALIFSRIETSILVKRLLYTFEAVYLIAWMLVFLVGSITQIPIEIDARSAKVGMSSGQYIFFCVASFFCMAMAFVVVLFSDALIHISRWFKIYMHAFFLAASFYTWFDIRFIQPDRMPIVLCVGNSQYTCSDTSRIRIGAVFAISLFVLRNMVILLRHQCRYSSANFGGMQTQPLVLIKSAVVLNADEISVSTHSLASVEPKLNTVTALDQPPHVATPIQADMRVLDFDHQDSRLTSPIPPSDATFDSSSVSSSAVVRVIGVRSADKEAESIGSQSSMESSAIMQPGSSTLESNPTMGIESIVAIPVSHNLQHVALFSLFGINVDSRIRPQRMLLGASAARLWRSQWFVAQFIFNFIAVLILFFMQEPKTSVAMIYVVWAAVCLLFIQMLTLIDMRIIYHLTGSFEFWFLQGINLAAFVATFCSLVKEADGVASFTGIDPTIQFWSDICWNFVGFAGCAVISVADALMIRRRLKIALIAFWSLNLFRGIYWWMWITFQRPYTLPLDLCILSECFSTQIIRVQTTMTFAVFSAKYAFSLIRYPHALVILKSTILMGIPEKEASHDDVHSDCVAACGPASTSVDVSRRTSAHAS